MKTFAKTIVLALATLAAADIAPSNSERGLRGSNPDELDRALTTEEP
eukprot:CAMPEP_0171608998 /NCGR_PEP_ID=MMETSP0990-20121206/9233_1 /TAXON_ID=483369 /ORGANISM="non described non described, Strain CCMP2098" /LENGTH=46 /DNA_ID= /DNA_START= /DNA_END= /DNA_ORIENTATION=